MKKAIQLTDNMPDTDLSTVDQRLQFLEDFRRLIEAREKRPLQQINIKIDPLLLALFRQKCTNRGRRYQTQIKELMEDWLSKP